MSIEISRQLLEQVRAHAAAAYPHECCGLLAGNDRRVTEVHAMANIRESARNRYLVDPAQQFRVERDLARRGLEVLGYYHSHPDVSAKPSAYDHEHAWESYSYLIVSVMSGRANGVRCWELKDQRTGFVETEVKTTD